MKIHLTVLLTLTFFSGCTTTSEFSENQARPDIPAEGRATEKNIREWAEYYLATGTASDMAAALRMSRDRFWPDVNYEDSIFTEIEERNEAQKRQIERCNK